MNDNYFTKFLFERLISLIYRKIVLIGIFETNKNHVWIQKLIVDKEQDSFWQANHFHDFTFL